MQDVNSAAFGTQTGKEKKQVNAATQISPIAKAFQQGKEAADQLKGTLNDLKTAAEGFAKFLADAIQTLKDLNAMQPADWLLEFFKIFNPALNFLPTNPLAPPSSKDYGPLHPAVGPQSSIQGEGTAYAGGGMVVNTVVTIDSEVLGRQVDKYLVRRGRA